MPVHSCVYMCTLVFIAACDACTQLCLHVLIGGYQWLPMFTCGHLLSCADKQMYLGKEKERLSQLIEQRLQAKSTLGQVRREIHTPLSTGVR